MPTGTLDPPATSAALDEDIFSALIAPAPARRRVRRKECQPDGDNKDERSETPVDRLYRLGDRGRFAAYRAGKLSRAERSIWAARFPNEVPLVNGEFEWIGLYAE